jgi:uncharacterized protein YbjT (DUF2867 family)
MARANDTILVIGGTRGVGLIIVHRLLDDGCRVRVLARNPKQAKEVLGPRVEIVPGDLTRPDSLQECVQGMDHIIFTAGVHSGRIARESLVKATDHDGVVETLRAARQAGFGGRLIYLNSIGVTRKSWAATLLNLLKRNALVWRRRIEPTIRNSGIDYTIIRVGFLLDRPLGTRRVKVSQDELALTPSNRIARADVAEAFLQALRNPKASRTTFDVVWDKARGETDWDALLGQLRPDISRLRVSP